MQYTIVHGNLWKTNKTLKHIQYIYLEGHHNVLQLLHDTCTDGGNIYLTIVDHGAFLNV